MSNAAKRSKLTWEKNSNLPALGKIRPDWDLQGLFYKSENDPRLESDVVVTETAFRKFAKKYQNGKWTKNSASILKALKEYVDMQTLPGGKPLYYFSYRQQLDAKDTVAERSLNKLSDRLTKVGNEILFFPLIPWILLIREYRRIRAWNG